MRSKQRNTPGSTTNRADGTLASSSHEIRDDIELNDRGGAYGSCSGRRETPILTLSLQAKVSAVLKRHALFFIAITGAVHLVLMWRSNASIGHAQDSYKNVSAMVPPQVHLAPQCLKPKDGDNKRNLNTDGIPTVTVIIPIYKGSMYVRQLMKALIEQTYPCLEFLVAIEPTDDAHETFRILKEYASKHPSLRMMIHHMKHRLQFAGIMNWLYSHVEGYYYSYMQCDDLLPPDYYAKLVQCLDSNPKAVNCYPRIVRMTQDEDGQLVPFARTRMESITGPTHERIWNALNIWIPFRGVVRRPKDWTLFSQPRLHKIYTASDEIVLMKQAIAGELIEVDVLYYKLIRPDSIQQSQHNNNNVLSITDFKLATIDEYARKFNLGYSHTASSDTWVQKLQREIVDQVKYVLGDARAIDDEFMIKQSQIEVRDAFIDRIREVKRVAVLGAGIQGCLMALMFSKHGYDVTLIDKSQEIMNRASIAGESRIHLGLEYSNDTSMRTASYMLESALRFSSYFEYLVGKKVDWSGLKSQRLVCLLAKQSLVPPEDFERYGEVLGNMYEALLTKNPELSYLGERPPKLLIGETSVPSYVNSSMIETAYESIEVCILSRKLKEIIQVALLENSVNMVFGRTILDVKRNDIGDKDKLGGLRVVSDIGEHDYDAVVNCLWEGRASIDAKMGLDNNASNESYRVKASIRLPNHESLAEITESVSIMNGPFGDFVRYGPDDHVYFAWHPASPKLITKNSTEISQYEQHANFDFPDGFEEQIVQSHINAFKSIFPSITNTKVFDSAIVGAGYVVANGETDIADKYSGLHERRDPPNLVADGYVSVKTQKFTNAPFNVYQLEQELFVTDLLVTDKRRE